MSNESGRSDVVSECMNLFYRARSHRRPMVTQWVKNYQVLHNRAWGQAPTDGRPSPKIPEIKPIVGALVAWKTDTEPIFTAMPAANPYSPFYEFYDQLCEDITVVMKSGWQHRFVDAELEKMLWDGDVYGIGWLKTVWDDSLSEGLGDWSIKRIDPFTVYWDPQATCVDDSSFFVEVRNMSRDDIETRWPQAKLTDGANVTQSGDVAPTRLTGQAQGRMPLANPGAINGTGSASFGLPGQTRERFVDDDGVTVFEFWLKRPVKVDQFVNPDPDAPTITPVAEDSKRVYSAWRCVIIAGGEVLMDEPADNLWSHGQHPYDRYVPEDTGEMVADSLVELLTDAQVSINRILGMIEHNIWLTGNPVFLESNRANISRSKIMNRPGQRIMVNGDVNNNARWMSPPDMSPSASQLVQFYIGEMERISGLSAIVRGATPTGRNAQGVLDSVQDAAFVRIRMSLRNMERTLVGAGNKAVACVAEFYDQARVVSLIGPGGEATSRAISGAHFYVPTDEGRVPLNFQVMIDVGSKQATSQQARFAQATTLAGLNIIDGASALEMINLPGWQQIAKRTAESQAAAGQDPNALVGARAAAGH